MAQRLLTWDVRNLQRGEKGRFRRMTQNEEVFQGLLKKLQVYHPKIHLAEIIRETRFDKLLVDRQAKDLLDKIGPSSEISSTSFLETLDDFSDSRGIEIKMLQIVYPPKGKRSVENYHLVVVTSPENIKLINECFGIAK